MFDFPLPSPFSICPISLNLRHQLNDTTGLGDLLLRELADVPGADDDRDLGEAALAKDLGVAEGQEVEDGDGLLLLAVEVGITGLGGDEGPELVDVYRGGPEVVLQVSVRGLFRVSSGENAGGLHTGCLWKYLIPTLPKYP